MRKLSLIVIAAIATGLIVGGVIACGSGKSSSNNDVTVPELKPPSGSTGLKADGGTTGDPARVLVRDQPRPVEQPRGLVEALVVPYRAGLGMGIASFVVGREAIGVLARRSVATALGPTRQPHVGFRAQADREGRHPG